MGLDLYPAVLIGVTTDWWFYNAATCNVFDNLTKYDQLGLVNDDGVLKTCRLDCLGRIGELHGRKPHCLQLIDSGASKPSKVNELPNDSNSMVDIEASHQSGPIQKS